MEGRLRQRVWTHRGVMQQWEWPKRIQSTLKENETRLGGWSKTRTGTGRLVEVEQSLKEGQHPTLTGWGKGKGRENRESVTIGEEADSMRGLTRVQYPSRLTRKGY